MCQRTSKKKYSSWQNCVVVVVVIRRGARRQCNHSKQSLARLMHSCCPRPGIQHCLQVALCKLRRLLEELLRPSVPRAPFSANEVIDARPQCAGFEGVLAHRVFVRHSGYFAKEQQLPSPRNMQIFSQNSSQKAI